VRKLHQNMPFPDLKNK